jgi:hypothetical protein
LITSGRRAVLASALVYVGLTAVMGRRVLESLGSSIVHDAGDPLLNAAILTWNARHVPWTDAWFQFPIFYPTRDALMFSEHLLGVSVLSTPLYWITRDPLVTYNLTLLLTFPLCALAMYALVQRLTGSAAAAFLAGLAFGFAPYRVAHLPHIQVLAIFWAPLALLGLHAYLETGRRRWLIVFGAAWMLQGAANGYFLVYFSVVVGLWTAWFVVAPRRWRDLATIAVAAVVAALPLVPIVVRYVRVHSRHGFERGIDEIRTFGGDIASMLCAPRELTFWNWLWLDMVCSPERELFAGLTLSAGLLLLVASLMLSPVVRVSVRRSTATGFYLIAAAVTWILAWGPSPTLLGTQVLYQAPYSWLMQLPGVTGLRVPARFWMMTVLCLVVAMGVLMADVLKRRTRRAAVAIVTVAACGLVIDGWTTVPVWAAPDAAPNPSLLRGSTTVDLGLGDRERDIPAVFRAATGGWRTVNGYSGYEPAHYDALRQASAAEDEILLAPFLQRGDLHVIVTDDSPRLRPMVERQPGVRMTGRGLRLIQYHIARSATIATDRNLGVRLDIRGLAASCSDDGVKNVTDSNPRTRWACGPQVNDQELTVDLGRAVATGGVVHMLGPYRMDFPRQLTIETSLDGAAWDPAWRGPGREAALLAEIEDEKAMRMLLPFRRRVARYVRLRQVGRDPTIWWSIAEIEIWSGTR